MPCSLPGDLHSCPHSHKANAGISQQDDKCRPSIPVVTYSLIYKSGTPDSMCFQYILATVIQSSATGIPHVHILNVILDKIYLNQWVMWAACPPCRQDWHHVNQDENSAILLLADAERPLLLVLLLSWSPEGVPIWTRHIAQRGKGFRHCGHDDICNILYWCI
jgi:hypothetical protein